MIAALLSWMLWAFTAVYVILEDLLYALIFIGTCGIIDPDDY